MDMMAMDTRAQVQFLHSLAETVMGLAVAAVMMHLEMQRRGVGGLHTLGSMAPVAGAKRLLHKCAPEIAGSVCCLGIAIALRIFATEGKPVNDIAWEQIKNTWPILLTADSLLAVQAMLRVLVGASAVLRGGGAEHSQQPLAGWPALMLMGACVARCVLPMRTSVYLLDGPIGGYLPVVCEMAAVPILAVLGARKARESPKILAAVVTLATWVAMNNHLSLAKNHTSDGFFALAHALELCAALVYLCRAVCHDNSACTATGFAHLLMPAQQAMSAYYFAEAFEEVPALIGAGHPFELLRVGGAAQLGMYIAATVLYIAMWAEGSDTDASSRRAPAPQAVAQAVAPPAVM